MPVKILENPTKDLKEGSSLIIDKKPPRLRGEDEYQSFTIRVSKELEETLSSIAYRTMRSRNDVVNILLEHAVKEVVIPDE